MSSVQSSSTRPATFDVVDNVRRDTRYTKRSKREAADRRCAISEGDSTDRTSECTTHCYYEVKEYLWFIPAAHCAVAEVDLGTALQSAIPADLPIGSAVTELHHVQNRMHSS